MITRDITSNYDSETNIIPQSNTMWFFQGPRSRELLNCLTDTDLDNDSFPFSTHQLIEVAGHKVRALRVSFVGELGKYCMPPFLSNDFNCPVIILLNKTRKKD